MTSLDRSSSTDSPKIPSRISVPFYLEESAQGFTMGLYLYVYGKFVDTGLNATSWLSTEMFFSTLTFFILAFEIPTGFIADWKGKAVSLQWSFLWRGVFFLLMLSAWVVSQPDFYVPTWMPAWLSVSMKFEYLVIAAAIVFAFSYTLRSGALNAWLHDSLDVVEQKYLYARIYARGRRWLWTTFVLSSLFGIYMQDLEYSRVPDFGYAHILFLLGSFISLTTWFFLSVAIVDPRRDTEREEDSCGWRSLLSPRGWRFLPPLPMKVGLFLIALAGGFAMILIDASDFRLGLPGVRDRFGQWPRGEMKRTFGEVTA